MKKILVLLLALAMLCESAFVLAEGGGAVTLELNTAKLPVYAAGDPLLDGLTAEQNLPVLVLPVKRSTQLQVAVQPRTVRNKRVTLTADNEEVVRVNGSNVTGLKPGEALLTIASQEDPSVTLQYRIVVIQPVTRISVTAPEKSVAVGSSMTLTPALLPEDASLKKVIWSSADERIATVDENGTVTGVKKGNARILAAAADGSNTRANISIRITQSAEEITLDKTELTVDVGRNGVLKPTVLPKDADDKKVVWSSSDESVATVNAGGRVSGVALGECEIICTSQSNGEVQAKALVRVQQPVRSIAFDPAPSFYNGETAQLTWKIEPENASNQALKLTSSNEKIVKVSDDGTMTGISGGEAFIKAITTDGSNRQARIKVKVFQHVTGVHMKRKTAYIDLKQSSTAGAILEPSKATNNNMTWESANPSVATVEPESKKEPNRVRITGVKAGETVVTGTTEDGGFQTSIRVRVGHWEDSLKLTKAAVHGDQAVMTVKNVSDLNITSVTAEISVYDIDGKPVPCNKKNKKSNTFTMVYTKKLAPGASTKEGGWKVVDYKLPKSLTVSEYVIRIVSFEIDHDWIKTIRKNKQPTKKCPVHL